MVNLKRGRLSTKKSFSNLLFSMQTLSESNRKIVGAHHYFWEFLGSILCVLKRVPAKNRTQCVSSGRHDS